MFSINNDWSEWGMNRNSERVNSWFSIRSFHLQAAIYVVNHYV